MLPILRIIPVGGVALAIVILLMALSPPDGSRPQRMMPIIAARGPLVDRTAHPEQRQFLMLAALHRAQELERLRDLPDAPTITEVAPAPPAPAPVPDDAAKTDASPPAVEVAPEPPVAAEPAPPAEQEKVAALPAGDDKAVSDDSAAAAPVPEAATIPVEIGEASSTELPVVMVPLPMPRAVEPRRLAVKHRRHAIHHRYVERRKPPVRTVMQYDPNFNLFAVLFGGFNYDASRKYGFSNNAGSTASTNVIRQQ